MKATVKGQGSLREVLTKRHYVLRIKGGWEVNRQPTETRVKEVDRRPTETRVKEVDRWPTETRVKEVNRRPTETRVKEVNRQLTKTRVWGSQQTIDKD